MRFLLNVASGLNAVYRTILFTWLIYCLVQQFKYRREIIKRRHGETRYPRRLH
jgi:hypothetical protein